MIINVKLPDVRKMSKNNYQRRSVICWGCVSYHAFILGKADRSDSSQRSILAIIESTVF